MADNIDYTVKELNDDQRNAYVQILECLREKKVILIDTPSGTGKTFMLIVLARSYHNTNNQVQFLTLSNDQASVYQAINIQASTYCSYIMSNLDLSYVEATKLKDMDDENNADTFCTLIKYARSYKSCKSTSIIIVDTYTLMSPMWLLLLYILAFKNEIKLIFVGDKMQPGAMTRSYSQFDDTNNFYLATQLSDLTIDYLTRNMRSSDQKFLNKLSSFRESLERYSRTRDAPFRFNLRYLLYGHFGSKYFTEERFDTVYMAQCNHDLTRRLYRFKDDLDSTGTKYVIEPFYVRCFDSNGFIPITILDQDPKFFPGLLLSEGYEYIYTTNEGEKKFVCLERIVYNDRRQEDSLFVRPINNELSHQVEIKRCNLYYKLPWMYKEWLLEKANKKGYTELWQFPLRLQVSANTLTYHAALGRTVDKDVEFCTDSVDRPYTNANLIYTGLRCVTGESKIHKIHDARNLLSFKLTKYMETKLKGNQFYYRWDSNVPTKMYNENNFIDNIKWKTVCDIKDFEYETITGFLRIERSLYEPPEPNPSALALFAKFIKNNENVLNNTITKIDEDKILEAKDVLKREYNEKGN